MPYANPIARLRAVAALLLLALAPGCGAFPRVEPASTCRLPEPGTAGWREVRTSAFALRLPPGYRDTGPSGIDSEVAGWAAADHQRLEYDYGLYSGPYSGSAVDTEVEQCTVQVNGASVELATFRRPGEGLRVHAHWSRARPVVLGRDTLPTSLMIYGRARDEAGRRELLAIISTVRVER